MTDQFRMQSAVGHVKTSRRRRSSRWQRLAYRRPLLASFDPLMNQRTTQGLSVMACTRGAARFM